MFRTTTSVGLDIGQTTTKLVVLQSSPQGIKVAKSAVINNWEEGIVTPEELGQHLGTWLREQGASRQDLIVGLPQYMAIAQLSDFPPAKRQQLSRMVALETQQLAGLSDEAFLHDYCPLPPFLTYQNPVMIGVCRARVARDRLEPLISQGLHVGDVAMDGKALAASFAHLLPDNRLDDKLYLVLDIGLDNTTMVVMRAGQMVHVASVGVGGHIFTSALARHLGASETEAERTKMDSRILISHLDSPLTQAARTFASELHGALEHWHFQGDDEEAGGTTSAARFKGVYLCGGGARLGGLSEFLEAMFDCPVSLLTAPGSAQGERNPQYAIAYGLALEGLAQRGDRISLAPPVVTWTTQRMRRAPYLYASLLLFTFGLAIYLITSYIGLQTEAAQLRASRAQLDQCRQMIPDLETTQTQIRLARVMLQPVVACANRNEILLHSIALLSKYEQQGDWLILLADEVKYYNLPEPIPLATSAPVGNPQDTLLGMSRPAKSGVSATPVNRYGAWQCEPWHGLVASGFTPPRDHDQWASVRKLVDGLNADKGSIFTRVDTLTDGERSATDFNLVKAWWESFKLKSFALRLPLRDPEFVVEAPKP